MSQQTGEMDNEVDVADGRQDCADGALIPFEGKAFPADKFGCLGSKPDRGETEILWLDEVDGKMGESCGAEGGPTSGDSKDRFNEEALSTLSSLLVIKPDNRKSLEKMPWHSRSSLAIPSPSSPHLRSGGLLATTFVFSSTWGSSTRTMLHVFMGESGWVG
mgnify:CR=1 FL=1